jgi:peptide/nickel transport system permease protein
MTASNRLLRTLFRTLLHAVPTVFGILVINFLLLQLAPGDAADVFAGQAGAATAETMAAMRKSFGLDQPLLVRLVSYLGEVAHLSLGVSTRYNAPVVHLLMERLPNTLALMGTALSIALAIGIALGTVMACFAGGWLDRTLSTVVLVCYSVPGFWISLMLIVVFSIKLGVLPTGGSETIGSTLTGLPALLDRLRYLVLPATSMALFFIAIYCRLMRAAMLETLSLDYVRTAHAKGLAPVTIMVRHVLRNALLPVTTMAGMHFGAMLGGAIVIETVYSWPGLGRLAFEGLMSRDFNVLLGILFLSSMLVVFSNALVDMVHAWLDPRIGGD